MERKCGRCGQKMENEQFLCPKCGAIYGQPEYNQPKIHPVKQDPKPQKRIHPMMVVMLTLLVEAALCIMLWKPITGLFVPQPNTHPSTTSTAPTTGIEPEVYYVKVVDQIGNPVPDVTISYRVVNLSAAQQTVTDENGTVVIPRTGGYEYFQVVEIPASFTLSGIEKTSVSLSERIEYTVYLEASKLQDGEKLLVTVLDSNLEPIRGVGVNIVCPFASMVPDIIYTDSQGHAEMISLIGNSYYASIFSVPLGYSSDLVGKTYFFQPENGNHIYFILEDETIPEGTEKYVVRFCDQNDSPVSGALVTITDDENSALVIGQTNQDGYFWAYLPADDSYLVTVNPSTTGSMQHETVIAYFRDNTEIIVELNGYYFVEEAQ